MSHKLSKIIILVFLLAFPLVSFTLPSLPVFASGEGGGGNVDPTISHIIIDNAGIHYPTSADQNTAKFANNTLTLDNYNGGPIEISSDNDVTIMLKGKNIITADTGISARTNLTIDGDGELDINAHDNGIALSYDQVLTINGGTTKILGYDDANRSGGKMYVESFLMNGGVLDVSGAYDCQDYDGIFVQNGGKSSFRSLDLGEKGVFNQNGGELTVNEDDERIGEEVALSAAFAVFNGGTTNITSVNSAAMIVNGESSLPSFDLDKIGAVLPKNGASVEFNGGDITFSGGMMPFMIAFDNGYDEQKTYVNISENMNIDPSYAKFVKVMLDTGGGDPLSVMGLAYSDGADEIEVDTVNFTFSHALKKVRIYKLATPAADDEENPNTVDTKIIALAFGTLFAIIAEGAIIADLYRRLFGYKKAISNINTSEIEPEPTPETPETPSDPEIPAPQA